MLGCGGYALGCGGYTLSCGGYRHFSAIIKPSLGLALGLAIFRNIMQWNYFNANVVSKISMLINNGIFKILLFIS
jgi:hypothetical protein